MFQTTPSPLGPDLNTVCVSVCEVGGGQAERKKMVKRRKKAEGRGSQSKQRKNSIKEEKVFLGCKGKKNKWTTRVTETDTKE